MKPARFMATQVGTLAAFVAWVVGPFAAAGGFGWRDGWLYFAVLGLALMGHSIYVAKRNPALRQTRGRIGANTPQWDLAWNVIFWWLMAAAPILAGAQYRSRVAPMPLWVTWPGITLIAAGLGISALAMAHNAFFEGTVRLQTDRGQRVVGTGPYARIRHPGYLGLCLWTAGTPLLLRSSWAVPVAIAIIGWVVLRTALEDRMLQKGLQGYSDYAARVRWRLVRGLW